MIIDAKTIVITLSVVVLGFIYGVKMIRKFALQIARENHDAVTAMEQEEEQQRVKKERAADAAAASAFAKVEPLLKTSAMTASRSPSPRVPTPTAAASPPQQADDAAEVV